MKADPNKGFFRYFTGDTVHGGGFNIYQARNGSIILLMNTNYTVLTKSQIEDLHIPVLELTDFDLDDYRKFYSIPNP